MKTIFYLTGQRKRKRLGTVKEVKEIGGAKLYRIVKRWKESWIKESDIVKSDELETKTEETKSHLGDNGGRDKAANEVKEFVESFAKGVEIELTVAAEDIMEMEADPNYIPPTNPPTVKIGVQGQSQADAGIPQDSLPVASGEALRVCGNGSGGEPDMFPEIASRLRCSPQKRALSSIVDPDGILGSGVSGCSSVDRSEPKSSQGTRVDPAKLELANLSQAEIDRVKKQIYRGARSGRRDLSEFSSFIRAMAEKNDARFFIKLSKALEARKR